MKKRVIITTAVSFLLLFAVVMAGLNAIFTVSSVRLTADTYSGDGEAKAFEIQEKLNGFVGDSLTFLKTDKLSDVVKDYPYFRVESVEKSYPDEVHIKIAERKEAYVFLISETEGQSVYAVMDEEGNYLYEKNSTKNRGSGENIRMNGFSFEVSPEGKVTGTYYKELIQMLSEFRRELGEIRANVVSVTLKMVYDVTATDLHYFRVAMREGVYIDIYNPLEHITEKARRAICYYAKTGEYSEIGLNDAEKIQGVVTVFDEVGTPDYDPKYHE